MVDKMSADVSTALCPPISLRTSQRGGTGHQTWNSSHILAGVLLARDSNWHKSQDKALPKKTNAHSVGEHAPLQMGNDERSHSGQQGHMKGCILELGAGTGNLAVSLALAGWRGVFATDGEGAVVRNMKYNVQANRLGHAVRCCKWSWEDDPPKGLQLDSVELVIGADLVYYNRRHGMLAAVLHRILTARSPDDPRPPARALLLCCIRKSYEDGCGKVFHDLANDGYAGSSVQRFIEEELPSHGLIARRHQISDEVYDQLGDDSTKEGLASSESRNAYHLYQVELQGVHGLSELQPLWCS
jgi:hypothetical protein